MTENASNTINIDFMGTRTTFLIRDARDHIQNHLLERQTFYEADLITFLFRTFLPEMVFVDVGAYIGTHTLFAANVLKAQVIAIEPSQQNIDHLIENLALNNCADRVTIHECAAWDHLGTGELVLPDHAQNAGMARIRAAECGTTALRRLDDLISSPVDIVKIDVEGAELRVLRGARRLIDRNRPLLILECQTADAFRACCEELEAFDYRPLMRFCVTPTYVFAAVSSFRLTRPLRWLRCFRRCGHGWWRFARNAALTN